MEISVIGLGYLGAVHAASMAELGHDVVGVDVDEARIALLNDGVAPFHEAGLQELLERHVGKRLRFTSDYQELSDAEVHFICVGTPQQEGSNAAEVGFVDAAVDSLIPNLQARNDRPALVVGKSTVPVGTASRLAGLIPPDEALLVWNPEFLREGFAVQDTLSPDRMVYGLPSDPDDAEIAREILDAVYDDLITNQQIPRLLTDYATAELVKVAANSFLATKVSFINAMAELCEATGADVVQLAEAIGYDERIGNKFLRAGIGFGGGCLPKDIRAFMARAGELGVDQALTFLREVDNINYRRRAHVTQMAVRALGGHATGKRVAILGASFKPNTDDTRDSPALDVAERLYGAGATVVVTDPQAGRHVVRERPHLETAADAREAMTGADLVLLLTEWDEFRDLDPVVAFNWPKRAIMIDGRNVLDPISWRAAGWEYHGIGRP